MKTLKFLVVSLLLLTASTSVFSQASTGKVYLIRVTGYTGSAVNYRFYIDDRLVCKMKNKTFSVQDLSLGDHTISVVSGGLSNGKKSAPLKINVSADKTNYITVSSTQSGYVNKITCQEITKNSAEPLLAKAKQKQDCLSE
jgi:hypothetical protein